MEKRKKASDGTSKTGDKIEEISFEEYLSNLNKVYRNLIENGWTYNDIENMDIHGFLNLMDDNSNSKARYDDIEAFYNSI